MEESQLSAMARILLRRFKAGVRTKADVDAFLNANLITQAEHDFILEV